MARRARYGLESPRECREGGKGWPAQVSWLRKERQRPWDTGGCANPGEGQVAVGWWGVEWATSQRDKSHLEYSAKGQAKCYWEWFFVYFCFALDFWRQGLEVRQKGREMHRQEEKKPLTRVWLKPLITWKIKNFNILSIFKDLPSSRDFLGIPSEVPFTVKGHVIMPLCNPLGPTSISPSCNPIQGTCGSIIQCHLLKARKEGK